MGDLIGLNTPARRSAGLAVLLFLLPFTASGATPAEPISTSICAIVQNPALYEGKEVSIRVRIFAGRDITVARDLSCPVGGGFRLNDDDTTGRYPDVKAFMRGIRAHGVRADATVTGSYSSKTPGWPYPGSGLSLHGVSQIVYDPD